MWLRIDIRTISEKVYYVNRSHRVVDVYFKVGLVEICLKLLLRLFGW